MNSFNDLQEISVTFDDTVDMQVTMYPRYAPTSADYYYGNDSVSAKISNLGNHSVTNPLVRFVVSISQARQNIRKTAGQLKSNQANFTCASSI